MLETGLARRIAPGRWREWRTLTWLNPYVRIALLLLSLRVTLSLFAVVLSFALPLLPPCAAATSVRQAHAAGLGFAVLGVWQRNDACAYEHIADQGYQAGTSDIAFFPLFPLAMRVMGTLLGGTLTLGGLVVSSLAYIAAALGLYRLLEEDFNPAVARRAIGYLTAFPTAFFFFAPYTEALFLALAVWLLYAARRGAWGYAALLAILVGLTRAQGSLCALPLAWEFVRQWRQSGKARPPLLAAVVPALPIAALAIFWSYGRFSFGISPLDGQRFWGMQTHTPWTVLTASWRQITARGDAIEALNLAALCLAGLMLLVGLRRLPFSYICYAAPQLLLLSVRQNAHTPLMSTSRLVLVLFPVFVVLAL
ncbi:MAG: hypothetical protein ACTHMP_08865, partial [Thermomicrobiales bacterium]